MENNFDDKMYALGYNHLVCNIFSEWEDVKDELLPTDRKSGSGNGTIHVFLGRADSELRKEFGDYYNTVEAGEDPSVKAVEVKHFFSASNVFSMIGFVCKYYADKGEDFTAEVSSILNSMSEHEGEETLTTTSFFKLSTGSNRLRPYFKQFDSKGVFSKIIRCLLLPNSAYKISLYRSDDGQYAAYWLIGSEGLSDFEADANKKKLEKEVPALELPNNRTFQQIYYGAPGTGKSHVIKEMTKGAEVIRTTFHPDSDYSTFVGTYKPTTKEITMRDLSGKPVLERNEKGEFVEVKEEKIVYEFVQQAFLQAYVNAWKQYAKAQDGEHPKEQYLVIEEINRGNCAQIFGDLFQLLDRNGSGFSDYPIKADNDMKKQLAKTFAGLTIAQRDKINDLYKDNEDDIVGQVLSGEKLLLPNNLYIWATMNTSDQSLFPIDSAFKRRWDWKYMPIHNAGKQWRIAANGAGYDWWQFLDKINAYIGSTTNSEDKKLGYFFCNPKTGTVDAETFVGKVIFYLWNDVFKDEGFDSELFLGADGAPLTFDKFYGADAATIREENIAQFLKNLKVEVIDGNQTEDVDDPIKEEISNNAQVRFAINGQGKIAQRQLAYEAVKNYVERHTDATVEHVINVWANTTPQKDFVLAEKDWLNQTQNFREKRSQALQCVDGKVYIKTNGWVYRTEQYGDTTGDFIRLVNSREDLGINITTIEDNG